MTIDERLERLVERHEALAQSVELQGHTIDKILVALEKDAENIRGLASIAQAHEHRLTDLEGGSAG